MQGNIAIVGAGSIGCYIGACLNAAGFSTTLIGRERIRNQIIEHGLRVTDWRGRDSVRSIEQIQFSLSMNAISNADYILLTVKSGDTESAAKSIREHAKASAVILSFQNGTQNAAILKSNLPHHKVIKAMVPFNVLNNGEGHFHCGTEGNLAIEANNDEHADLILAFERANLPVDLYENIEGVQWGKLIMNLNNAVNALSGVPLLEQLNNRSYRLVMKEVIAEALAVLRVAGIKPARTGKVIPSLMPYILALPNFLFKRVASATLKIDPQARSSMYEDLMLNRKTEIDYLNGEIVSLAKQHGVSAPVNQSIVNLIKTAEQEQDGSPMLSAKRIQNVIKNAVEVK
ncbi:2-dehydropantoate 2-reductase [Glaciecola sp. MF2-115]|uniref:2-dehydropantoate 2-reductase n=1 Tax=Glaciecola sp. MF2-115 TaxID=3384827 RepID=UPI0039A321E7